MNSENSRKGLKQNQDSWQSMMWPEFHGEFLQGGGRRQCVAWSWKDRHWRIQHRRIRVGKYGVGYKRELEEWDRWTSFCSSCSTSVNGRLF